MFLILLTLGGGAILADTLLGGSSSMGEDDADEEVFSKETSIDQDTINISTEVQEITPNAPTLVIETPTIDDQYYDTEKFDNFVELPDIVKNFIQDDETDSIPENPVCINLVYGDEITESGDFPLSDWASSPSVVKVDLADCDVVFADLPPEEGSLHILRADYYERTGSEVDDDLEIIHTGANIYLLPPGEEFPDDYVWSESGASLYNSNTHEDDPQDFGNIKLISRVSTGLIYDDIQSEESSDFSHRAFSELQERFVSNRNYIFVS
jgi:hypothetical protein